MGISIGGQMCLERRQGSPASSPTYFEAQQDVEPNITPTLLFTRSRACSSKAFFSLTSLDNACVCLLSSLSCVS